MTNADRLPRAAWWEIVGAWLHVWTPPRGAYVPPVPVRSLVAAALVAAAATTALVVAIGNWKENGQQEERARQAAADARIRAGLAREQSPHHARIDGSAAAAASASERPLLRRRLIAGLEAQITADAAIRYDENLVGSRVRETTCIPYVRPSRVPPPEPPPAATSAGYECLGITSSIEPTAGTVPGELGYPFWARVDYEEGSVVWCKISPRSAERGIGGDLYVALDPECDLAGG